MTKAVSRPNNAKQKWVPKTDAKGEDEDDGIENPELCTRSEGCYYDRIFLLQIYQLSKAKTEDTITTETVKAKLSERPVEEDTGSSLGTRRALRDQVKAQKIAKRSSTESWREDMYPVSSDPTHNASSIMQNLAGYGPMNPAMLQYMQSMCAWPMHPMMYGTGGQSTGTSRNIPNRHGRVNPAMMQYLHNIYASPMNSMMYGTGGLTTVMLRNIPNRYTREMLIERLKQGNFSFDFVYLPIDFNSKCNVGYAFINFRSPTNAANFIAEFHGAKTAQCLPGFSSAKICEVSYARVQGRDANMENLREEKFIDKLNERPEWQPLFLDENNEEIPFSKTLGIIDGKRSIRGTDRLRLKAQIEFYFSADNLCKDVYLRSHMDQDGWTPLALISEFNRVKKFKFSMDVLVDILSSSNRLEVDATSKKIRLKDEEARLKWVKVSTPVAV